jgi:hypothetical protein
MGKRAVLTSVTYAGYGTAQAAVWLGVNGYWPWVFVAPGTNFGGALQLRMAVYQNQLVVVHTVGTGTIGFGVAGYLFDEATLREPAGRELESGPGWPPEDPRWADA